MGRHYPYTGGASGIGRKNRTEISVKRAKSRPSIEMACEPGSTLIAVREGKRGGD
jgi:hypothetical protein